eukprot:2985933-Rhodomonas_salina.1
MKLVTSPSGPRRCDVSETSRAAGHQPFQNLITIPLVACFACAMHPGVQVLLTATPNQSLIQRWFLDCSIKTNGPLADTGTASADPQRPSQTETSENKIMSHVVVAAVSAEGMFFGESLHAEPQQVTSSSTVALFVPQKMLYK